MLQYYSRFTNHIQAGYIAKIITYIGKTDAGKEAVRQVITYKPFWRYLQKKRISTYMLIYKYGINSYTIDRLRHDKPLKTSTIDNICNRLHCSLVDVMEHEEEAFDEFTPTEK